MKIFTKKCLITILVLVFGFCVLAVTMTTIGSAQINQDDVSDIKYTDNDNSQNQNFAGLLLRTVLSLSLVVAILVLFMFGLRWLSTKARGRNNLAKQMRVFGSVPLGPKKALYMVQVFKRVLVLGVTDTTVSLLSEIADEKEVEALLQSSVNETLGAHGSFAMHLANFTKKVKL